MARPKKAPKAEETKTETPKAEETVSENQVDLEEAIEEVQEKPKKVQKESNDVRVIRTDSDGNKREMSIDNKTWAAIVDNGQTFGYKWELK